MPASRILLVLALVAFIIAALVAFLGVSIGPAIGWVAVGLGLYVGAQLAG